MPTTSSSSAERIKVDHPHPTAAATPEVESAAVPDARLSDEIGKGKILDTIPVVLSTDIIHLLSEQLYTSPLKAIEELVANAYDADADYCRVALFLQERNVAVKVLNTGSDGEIAETGDGANGATSPNAGSSLPGVDGLIAVFDNGTGMTKGALRDLWSVGNSPKKGVVGPTPQHGRMPIGKFGIGKLATYAVANRITYLTASSEGIHHVICDFTKFGSSSNAGNEPVELAVREVDDMATLLKLPAFAKVLDRLGLSSTDLPTAAGATWTLCLLDHLKPKARELQIGRLGWVLQTAMPLQLDFQVFLDGAEQKSSKEKQDIALQFTAGELEKSRIDALNKKFKMNLSSTGAGLVEPEHFPSGISGDVIVTWDSLKGKSDRYSRSFGFFIRVRGRLINLDDPLFHNPPHSFRTFNRFRADLEIDDLHEDLTAPREGVGVGVKRDLAVAITHEIGLQSRDKFERLEKARANQKQTPESTRVYVAEHLVERPMADALTIHGQNAGGDVEATWMYVDDVPEASLQKVVGQLYEKRTRYNFNRSALGETSPLTKFNPQDSTFTVNSDHELVQAFDDDPRARELIDLIAAAEVMLEVYLVENDITPFAIGEILNRRDLLLRSLATDRVYSRPTIAAMLRGNIDNDIQLELALIAAARALGFQVKHVAGAGEPDGIARFLDSAMKETKLTLEAKSSTGTPSLSAIDFAGLQEHMVTEDAKGCLVLAPSYPAFLDDGSATANRATNLGLSCWTVEQLARVVERGEDLEISASQIASIVMTKFAPLDVEAAINALLDTSTDMTAIYRGVMRTFRNMFAKKSLPGTTKRVSSVAAIMSQEPEFADLTEEDVAKAISTLANHSKGAIIMRKDIILFHADFDEVVRRVSSLTGDLGDPRSLGTFKN